MVATTATLTLKKNSWSSNEVCQLLGITYRQLDYWIREGLMAPSVARGRGYGTARRFSFDDFVYLELISQLSDLYVPSPSIKKALHHLRGHQLTLEELSGAFLVTDGADYFVLYYSDRELHRALTEAMQRGSPILTVALRNLIEIVRGKLGMENQFSRHNKRMSQTLTTQITEAVLTVLQSKGKGITDLDNLLHAVMRKTGAEYGEVFLFDQRLGRLILRAFRGPDDEPIQDKDEYEIGQGLPGLAAQTGEPIIRTFLGGEPRFMKRAQKKGIRFFACFPLKIGRNVLGTIHIASKHPRLPEL